MIWNWYARLTNEIFLDLDSRRALFRALQVFRRNAYKKTLNVSSIYIYPSKTASHFHMVVTLKSQANYLHSFDSVQAALWALWAGSDRLRGIYVLERLRRGVKNADVISTPHAWFRAPDATCCCPDKHKKKSVTDKCPAMTQLLLDARSSDYFPRNVDRKERKPVQVPYGRISKRFLMGR